MVFPFLAVFRMALIIFRLLCHYAKTNEIIYARELLIFAWIGFQQFFDWLRWWLMLVVLWLTYGFGICVYPMYEKFFSYLDANYTLQKVNKRAKRPRKNKTFRLLTLPTTVCVFTEIHNVAAQDLVMLSTVQLRFENSLYFKIAHCWNYYRNSLGLRPPDGWPLRILMISFVIIATIGTFCHVYRRYVFKAKRDDEYKKSKIFQTNANKKAPF